jgi:hypothetical protein
MALKYILALAAAVVTAPVRADAEPAEGVVTAILGDSDRVDLLPGSLYRRAAE